MKISGWILVLLGLLFVGMTAVKAQGQQRKVMTVGELLALKQVEADFVIPYGGEPLQFGELRLPEGEGPYPVVVIIHGGCWMSAYGLSHISPLAGAITGLGYATWSLEYRRIGNKGGGWPGTFTDVADGIDYLRLLSEEHPLDLDRVIIMGHSAGGHLALWSAARMNISAGSTLYRTDPLIPKGVVSLAGIADLMTAATRKICGNAVVKLLGGGSADVPDRYVQGSPAKLLPLGVKQILVQGGMDTVVPADSVIIYLGKARDAGDDIELKLIETAGHYELVTPGSIAWPKVKEALSVLIEQDTRRDIPGLR
jgi:acetyl esterase/lipase